jgi:hypothetical protein
MSYAKDVLNRKNSLVDFIAELAKDINGNDIDFGELAVDEDNLYKTLALSIADNSDIDDPIICRATILALTVENFVLNAKLMGKLK